MSEAVLENHCCKKAYQNICNVDIFFIEKETANFREKWFKERQFRVTASRCYELYTYSLSDWPTKARKYFWPKKFSNKYTDHGIKYEAIARNCYTTNENDDVIQTGLIISNQQKWLACSPDGIVFKDNRPVKLLEIKCPFEGK